MKCFDVVCYSPFIEEAVQGAGDIAMALEVHETS
jgi:hypothetical protein